MKDAELKHFKALSDVFIKAINQQNYTLTETISRFLYSVFQKERENVKDEPVVYPTAYYELVHKTIEELAILKNKKNATLEHRSAGSVWLLGELTDSEISEITYSWIWSNLSLAIRYEQDDMILYHWGTAHQYITYNLKHITPDYNIENGEIEIRNKEQVEKRNGERKKFFEFHYALGGLLTFSKRYDCLNRIFNYTISQPPKYELLPESMNEIFEFYFNIRDDLKYSWISSIYPFPSSEGISADTIVKKWISKYLAILFLRQYTIFPYLITMKPLDYPSLPANQGEKKVWIEGIDYFKRLVSEILETKELIKALNLEFINKEWCEENKKPFPTIFFENLKASLIESYEKEAVEIQIDKEKEELFYKSSASILESKIGSLGIITSDYKIENEFNDWHINGLKMVYPKDAFVEKPEVDHLEFDSFLATVIARKIDEGVFSTFLLNRKKWYVLKEDDLFEAVKELGLDEQYLLINCGLNISYYRESLKISGLSADKFNGLRIINLQSYGGVDPSLFAVKINDLPNMITNEIDQDIREQYDLRRISEAHPIYSSVMNLNEASKELLNELSYDKTEEELKKSVLLNIFIRMEIRWKKSPKMIHLIQYSEYRQKGLPNKLTDIKQVKNL